MCRIAARITLGVTLAGVLAACGDRREPASPTSSIRPADRGGPDHCPTAVSAPERMPGVEDRHLRVDYWLERAAAADLDVDEVLLSPAEIRDHNASLKVPRENFFGQEDLLEPVDPAAVMTELGERFRWLNDKFESGEYVRADGGAIDDRLEPPAAAPPFAPAIRVALEEVPLRCAPTDAQYFSPKLDLRFDHNRCSTARAQEPIQILAPWPGGTFLARTRHTWGWIPADAKLSPPLSEADAARFVRGPFASVVGGQWLPKAQGAAAIADGARVPLAAGGAAYVATAGGVVSAEPAAGRLQATARPLTRRAVLEEMFRYLGTPYGFGGAGGGRDCSGLVLDVLAGFGLDMPRHSAWQARAGSYTIEVGGLDEAARVALFDVAAQKGVVLLRMPGHILFYLGRDDRDRPMALHAFAEYLKPCQDYDGETLYEVGRVQVSDLELGRGSSRGAFVERITQITVIGKPPGVELAGVAALRPAAPISAPSPEVCRGASGERVLVSPARPSRQRALRVVATAPRDPGAVELALFSPDGRRVDAPVLQVGGPPHGYVAKVEQPAPGTWTAVLGEGDRVEACQTFTVHAREPAPPAASDTGPIWPIERAWSPANEDLYAVFVERLFDYPIDEDLTWPNLHTLLRDPDRNILFGHLTADDERTLELVPDCADLPYTLRAYFAWKLGLPFGYRSCNRARAGRPPTCSPGGDNLMSRTELRRYRRGDLFHRFDRLVQNQVHSSSGRTHPDDDNSDKYPVPLTREALRPGTMFNDAYGHILIIARWVPQGPDDYGILIAADAQPDGTVGRRRFWRGSFLFRTETDSGGAGFKAFRPWVQGADGALRTPTNEELRARHPIPYSRQQYEGTLDDFYDTMNALINPRPLDAEAVQISLVDALEEAVSRRITSVDNGEEFMRQRRYATMEMPSGASIFLTTGPWEDFSTPSRDWRLLVSLDTVADFPAAVARSPEQYGIFSDADAALAELRGKLEAELARRTITYRRSDGSDWTLTLGELIDRRVAFEMAYNPNDCAEIRWGAPEGSDEISTCKRHAPDEQRRRMEEYRHWFSERSRPAN